MWNKRLEIPFCGLTSFHRSWLWKFDPFHVFAILFSFLCTECFSSAKEFHILLQRCAQDVSWIPPSVCAYWLTRHIFVKLHKCWNELWKKNFFRQSQMLKWVIKGKSCLLWSPADVSRCSESQKSETQSAVLIGGCFSCSTNPLTFQHWSQDVPAF